MYVWDKNLHMLAFEVNGDIKVNIEDTPHVCFCITNIVCIMWHFAPNHLHISTINAYKVHSLLPVSGVGHWDHEI